MSLARTIRMISNGCSRTSAVSNRDDLVAVHRHLAVALPAKLPERNAEGGRSVDVLGCDQFTEVTGLRALRRDPPCAAAHAVDEVTRTRNAAGKSSGCWPPRRRTARIARWNAGP